MPTKRIEDEYDTKDVLPCLDPEHNPPTMQVFEPGHYEHVCPRCKVTTWFIVPRIL